MRLGYELTIKQKQQLSMTPEMVQAIKILQLNTLDLYEYVNDELIENPVLEEEAYEHIIRENIRYNDLHAAHPEDRKLIDGIAALILETVLTRGDSIVIASNRYPAAVVKSRFLKLNYSHIEYVLSCLRKNSTKVTNIRKYLLAVLFNAPSTMDGYYRAEVNHDMYSA